MKNMKRITSLLLSVVMVLSLAVGCMITTSAGEEPAQKVWTADAEWLANFEATKGTATEFAINDVDDLYALVSIADVTQNEGADVTATAVANTAGKTFYLTANLDLEGANFPGIDMLCGNFDGRGHSISNFTMNHAPAASTPSELSMGFIRTVAVAAVDQVLEIKNLVMKNVTLTVDSEVSAAHAVGSVLGQIIVLDAETVGAVKVQAVLLDNVDVTIESFGGYTGTTPWNYAGGVVGKNGYGVAHTTEALSTSLAITDTYYDGTITVNCDKVRFGGFLGGHGKGTGGNHLAPLTLTNNLNLAVFEGTGTGCQTRVWAAQSNADATKNIDPDGIDHVDEATTVTSGDAHKTINDLSGYTYLRKSEKRTAEDIPEGCEAYWVEDETYGILPAGLADAIYPLYIQQSVAPDANGKYSVRVLAAMNTLELTEMNFDVKVLRGTVTETTTDADWNTVTVPAQKKVYTSVLAAGETVTAANLGGKYLSGVVLTDIPAGETITIKVTPIRTLKDGTTTQASTIAYEAVVTFPAAS